MRTDSQDMPAQYCPRPTVPADTTGCPEALHQHPIPWLHLLKGSGCSGNRFWALNIQQLGMGKPHNLSMEHSGLLGGR